MMAAAATALAAPRVEILLAILFLAASAAAFASPAKQGLFPEFVPNCRLAQANGLVQASRYIAIVLGSGLGRPRWPSGRTGR